MHTLSLPSRSIARPSLSPASLPSSAARFTATSARLAWSAFSEPAMAPRSDCGYGCPADPRGQRSTLSVKARWDHARLRARRTHDHVLGAARYLAETRDIAGTVIFIFQPAEEGIGGAKAMLHDGLFERF